MQDRSAIARLFLQAAVRGRITQTLRLTYLGNHDQQDIPAVWILLIVPAQPLVETRVLIPGEFHKIKQTAFRIWASK